MKTAKYRKRCFDQIEGIVAENKALTVEVDRLRSEVEEKAAEKAAQEERLLDLNRRLADKEHAGALEARRQAGEELKNKSRELAGKSRFTLFDYTTFLFSCLY